MKMIKIMFVSFFALILCIGSMQAQGTKKATTKTDSFKVAGNCDMCKGRIEKAAKIDGVTNAEWSEKSQMLTLVYNPAKIKPDEVQKKIAAVGHDTQKLKAEGKAYNGLPGCCKYDRLK